MSNIIAIIWDFDKTLVNGYMQDPIFEKYGVDAGQFWNEVNALPNKYKEEQNVRVNPDTIYLNHFIHYVKSGKFKGLNNASLLEFGENLNFYEGVPKIFQDTKKLVENNTKYSECDIKVEHYIVSTGLTQIIRGSSVMPYVEEIWGCEFIEDSDSDGKRFISEIAYTIDNTTKTRALFEINKGVHKRDDIEVNTKVPEEMKRVHFENMIYIADGPSDVPAFSVVKQNKGSTFAIYPKGNDKAFSQVEQLRKDGRIDMYAEADYSKNTTAYMWIKTKILERAERIYENHKSALARSISPVPKHIT